VERALLAKGLRPKPPSSSSHHRNFRPFGAWSRASIALSIWVVSSRSKPLSMRSRFFAIRSMSFMGAPYLLSAAVARTISFTCKGRSKISGPLRRDDCEPRPSPKGGAGPAAGAARPANHFWGLGVPVKPRRWPQIFASPPRGGTICYAGYRDHMLPPSQELL